MVVQYFAAENRHLDALDRYLNHPRVSHFPYVELPEAIFRVLWTILLVGFGWYNQ